jgi:citrate lyase subunit beta-like protein
MLLSSQQSISSFSYARDYCADLGILRSPSRLELLYARQKLVATAVAAGVQAIDLVCVDFKNDSILQEECTEGSNWGFTGKQVIHPRQVAIVNASFKPRFIDAPLISSASSMEWAERIIKAAEDRERERGVGAFELDGKMIDEPVMKQARRILSF